MDTDMSEQELQEVMKVRLKELPKVVRDSITSADVEKHLRALADTNKLHIDQWQLLENNVMLTLLGFQKPEDLAADLKRDLEITDELADSLAGEVSRIVFEPIRTELERELEDPGAHVEGAGGIDEAMREHIPAHVPAVSAQTVIAATPPPAPPQGSAVRAPISSSYAARQPSHERKIVEGDPYREQVA